MRRQRRRTSRRGKGEDYHVASAPLTATRRPPASDQPSQTQMIQLARYLPQEPGARPLRQTAFLDIQKHQGNQRLQRLVAERAWSLEKTAVKQTDQPAVAQISSTGQPAHIQRGLWGKIKKAAKKVGGAIKKGAVAVGKGVKTAAGAIKQAAIKVGGAAKKAAIAVGKAAGKVWTGMKWVAKQTWSKIKGAGLRAINWARQLPARLGRLFKHLLHGVKSLKPWSLDWWKSLGKASTWLDFLKWTGELAVYGLEVAGIGEMYETVMDFIKFNTRPLTSDEKNKAQSVFGGTIQYDLVRVDDRALLGPSWTDREYVSFHTINGWGTMDDHTFIHEMTHVWQYSTTGAMYMPKAIHAQATLGDQAYVYGGVAGLEKRRKAGGGLTSFNPEQQGQIVADYYMRKTGQTSATPEQLATYEHFGRQARR
jgi:hypothetical protein